MEGDRTQPDKNGRIFDHPLIDEAASQYWGWVSTKKGHQEETIQELLHSTYLRLLLTHSNKLEQNFCLIYIKYSEIFLVMRTGLEPVTGCLRGSCSTN